MRLLEISAAILEVLEKGFTTIEETGEVFETEDLDQLDMAFEEKVDGIAYYIKNCEASAKAMKDEAKMLMERAKKHEQRADKLKKYLLEALSVRGMKKLETVKNKITTRKSTRVDIIDQDMLPKKYFAKKVEFTPDKKLIKETLEAGKNVKGAELETRITLQVK